MGTQPSLSPQFIPRTDAQPIPTGTEFNVAPLLPEHDAGEPVVVERPGFAYEPDTWTRALLRGLAALDPEEWNGKAAAEVGVGTGANAIWLLRHRDPRCVYASDLNPAVAQIAARNADRHLSQAERDRLLINDSRADLLQWLKDACIRPDHIYACIPQVPVPPGESLDTGDNLAHYYDATHYQSILNAWGLGLNDVLLQQARDILPSGGSVILTLAGRPGRDFLEKELIARNGFRPRLLYEELIPQHAETDLTSLACLEEASGRQFEFFGDAEGKEQINAVEAERRRKEYIQAKAQHARAPHETKEPAPRVFHKIYIFQALKP